MNRKMPLLTSIRIGNKVVPNRIAINAMECCDADTGGNPTETAFRRYERLARGNAGMIVVEVVEVLRPHVRFQQARNGGGPPESLEVS